MRVLILTDLIISVIETQRCLGVTVLLRRNNENVLGAVARYVGDNSFRAGDFDIVVAMAQELKAAGGADQAVSDIIFFDIVESTLIPLAVDHVLLDKDAGKVGFYREFAILMEVLFDYMEWLGNEKHLLLIQAKVRYPYAKWSNDYRVTWQ